jgi:hypothetical protein
MCNSLKHQYFSSQSPTIFVYFLTCIGLLHSQQFTKSNFHCLHSVYSATLNLDSSVFQNQFFSSCRVHIHPWCVIPTGSVITMVSVRPPLTLCTTFWQAAPSLRHQLVANREDVKRFRPQKPKHTTQVFVTPTCQCHRNSISRYPMNSVWLTDWLLQNLLRFNPIKITPSYRNMRCLTF